MKKLFIILLISMLLLTSCASKPTDEIAFPDTEEPMSQIEDSAPAKPSEQADTKPTKPSEQDKAPTKPPVTAEPGRAEDNTEDEEEIIIDGYVVNNCMSYPNAEMVNRDYKYEEGADGYIVSDLNTLYEMSDIIVVAWPDTGYDEGKQIWKDVDGKEVGDFDAASLLTSYTKRTFTVKRVIKGDIKTENKIEVLERAISDGVKMRILTGDYISEENRGYLLFLNKADDSDAYLYSRYVGKYKTDVEENKNNPNVDSDMLKKVFEEYQMCFTWIEY